ncbi:hypothetical protein INT47_005448, partial [Mucor saturninus]
KPSVGRTPSTTKRKSLLSELGIKSGDAPVAPTPRTRTTPPLNRRPSTTGVKPASPSVSKSRSVNTAPRKAAPAPVKVDRSAKISSAPSPTSPAPNRRSIVPSSQRSATISPLARRASVNSGSPNGSTVIHKRLSSPAGLDSLQEVQTMKEQIVQQELLLVEKEQQIQKLKQVERTLMSENELKTKALDELKGSEAIKREMEKSLSETESKHKQEMEKSLSETESRYKRQMEQSLSDTESKHKQKLEELEAKHKGELEKFSQMQDIKLQSLSTDYEQQISKLRSTYENQHTTDLEKLEKEKNNYMQQLISEQTMHEDYKKEQDLIVADLKSQLAIMEESASSSHTRKVQNELAASSAALEEFKRQSQQTTENLERRYRDEIRQLQSGSDDTALAWLEKTRSAQQKLDELHDELLRTETEHKAILQNLVDTHTEQIDRLTESCETKETEIEEQSSQIEDLLFQVETLQNSLEAATVRLEHTAKSTPTTSSNRDDINSLDVPHEPIKNIHQECLNRVDLKQKELQDFKAKMKELKEVHEAQLNRLGQEKATAVGELRKIITGLEQRLAATPPSSPTKSSMNEDRLISIAEQHRKEITTMHEQYQAVVDCKDRELEDYAYRVKAIVASKQKEVEKLQVETISTIDKYEKDIEGYEQKIIEYEKQSVKLQDRVTHWETLTNNNEALIQDMKKGCAAHRDENNQLIRLVNQLQSELHI